MISSLMSSMWTLQATDVMTTGFTGETTQVEEVRSEYNVLPKGEYFRNILTLVCLSPLLVEREKRVI